MFPCKNNCPLNRFTPEYSHLSALCDGDWNFWLVVGSNWHILNLSHDQQPINHFSKNHMLTVKEVALCTRDEELATVGVFSTVGLEKEMK
jgi:hypothetical protein